MTNFVNSLIEIIGWYSLDGVDLDIESYKAAPKTVADTIIQLRAALDKSYPSATIKDRKQIVVSPENVAVYQGTGVPSATVGGNAWNYFVPIINLCDDAIDYYQIQAYNNWYGATGGTFEYFKEVYMNWRNLQGSLSWAGPIKGFNGVAGNKLRMGVLASTSAGGAQYYAQPTAIKAFMNFLKTNNLPLDGFMMWDSNWDKLNGFAISNATTQV
jgi:chitinase